MQHSDDCSCFLCWCPICGGRWTWGANHECPPFEMHLRGLTAFIDANA